MKSAPALKNIRDNILPKQVEEYKDYAKQLERVSNGQEANSSYAVYSTRKIKNDLKHGLTTKEVRGMASWLQTTYKKALNDRIKELESVKESVQYNLEEAIRFIPLTLKIAESFDMTCPVKQFDQEKCHKMLNTAPSLVKDLGDVSIQFPNIIDPDELRRAIDDTKSDAQIGNVKINMVERYDMQNMYKDLSNTPIKESKASDIFTEARSLAVQTEIVRALNEVYSACVYYSPITEASFTNSLKLASEKIKKAFTKMSDKEKEISKNIDVSVNNVKKSAERALEADNREAVIKGSVLPSASKLIKLTIVNAALGILINPAVAVISTLGYLAVSKATKEKQRRAILDEIEIELKMCNKYIDLAESKNDLKALKKLYTIQRNLERQRAKIKFNLQVKGEKYHDPGDFDQHGIEH